MTGVIERTQDAVRILQIESENQSNSFSDALQETLVTALHRANNDDDVKAIVVCVGSTHVLTPEAVLNETKTLSSNKTIDTWIERITDLYVQVLNLEKPSVAAMDGTVIGMAFQFAMMADWRVMSKRAELSMSGLRHGIGSPIAATILNELTTLNTVREIIYRRENILAPNALQYGLVNDVVNDTVLFDEALAVAKSLSDYPKAAFQNTKRIVNQPLLTKLIGSASASKEVHRTIFSSSNLSDFFSEI